MKILDAHLHMKRHENFDRLCVESGHENNLSHLLRCFGELDICGGVVMGSGHPAADLTAPGLFDLAGEADPDDYRYPNSIAFCIGVNPEGLISSLREQTLARYARAAASPHCVGFKIYLGYRPYYAADPLYHPIYELAKRLDLPVVFHTGDTANSTARLKFSHPLTVDDAAVLFPDVTMILAHFGNPWLCDAAEVVKKNPNVYADLSGLAVGIPNTAEFHRRYAGYVAQLEGWLGYLDRWDHLLYGSDWPLVNLAAYLELIRSL
ncbi:MAG: amidohydrolase family protein, partial [Oscillospiraceae bacterium]